MNSTNVIMYDHIFADNVNHRLSNASSMGFFLTTSRMPKIEYFAHPSCLKYWLSFCEVIRQHLYSSLRWIEISQSSHRWLIDSCWIISTAWRWCWRRRQFSQLWYFLTRVQNRPRLSSTKSSHSFTHRWSNILKNMQSAINFRRGYLL